MRRRTNFKVVQLSVGILALKFSVLTFGPVAATRVSLEAYKLSFFIFEIIILTLSIGKSCKWNSPVRGH